MADFDKTYDKWIIPHEGGFANLKGDKGGLTYAGIAENIFPNWEGFAILHKIIETSGEPKNNTRFPELDIMARRFFNDLYVKNNFLFIGSQNVADILFDWFVNTIRTYAETGMSTPVKQVQRYLKLNVDGKLGPLTYRAINIADEKTIYNEIKAMRIAFYRAIVARDPSQAVFLDGWLKRINKFPTL